MSSQVVALAAVGLTFAANQVFGLGLIPTVALFFILSTVFQMVLSFFMSPKKGTVAPKLPSLNYVQGEEKDHIDFEKDQLVVLEFWATWCGPCVSSIPHINEVFKNYRKKGVKFVGVTQEKESAVLPFIKKMGDKFTYPVAIDSAGATMKQYSVMGIPHAVLIKKGKVYWSGHPMSGLEKQIDREREQDVNTSMMAAEPEPSSSAPGARASSQSSIGPTELTTKKVVLYFCLIFFHCSH
eukprot:Lithocolla_globosa_v1_NODE_2180_length_2124_cov_26.964199.p2 type:complete len:239 gc:universal NODE_2180_length_2124_cov_26.964199:846-130(-)